MKICWIIFLVSSVSVNRASLSIFSFTLRGENLKKGFGWFVLLMGIYIIVKEFFLNWYRNNLANYHHKI